MRKIRKCVSASTHLDLPALLGCVGRRQQLLRDVRDVDALLVAERHHPRGRVHRVAEETVARHLVAHDAGHHHAAVAAEPGT